MIIFLFILICLSNSAIGDVKVNEIHPEGKYIRIVNTHRTKVYNYCYLSVAVKFLSENKINTSSFSL